MLDKDDEDPAPRAEDLLPVFNNGRTSLLNTRNASCAAFFLSSFASFGVALVGFITCRLLGGLGLSGAWLVAFNVTLAVGLACYFVGAPLGAALAVYSQEASKGLSRPEPTSSRLEELLYIGEISKLVRKQGVLGFLVLQFPNCGTLMIFIAALVVYGSLGITFLTVAWALLACAYCCVLLVFLAGCVRNAVRVTVSLRKLNELVDELQPVGGEDR